MSEGVERIFPLSGELQGRAMISAERFRQIAEEGFFASGDDLYVDGALMKAAACYLDHALVQTAPTYALAHVKWPWPEDAWKPTTPIRDLVKAGALIAAEIDRRLRAGERP